MDWVSGLLFGVYLPLVTTSWLRVHAAFPVIVIVWNVLLSALFGSFGMWLLSGMADVQRFVSMAVLLFLGTGTLSLRMKAFSVVDAERIPEESLPHKGAFAYVYVAMFLFSVAFQVGIAFAELEGGQASFATGAFFAPFLLVCVLLLTLKSFTAFSLLNIAVPVVATATITASFLRVDPVITFDLAVVGLFMFLVYAVVLLCAQTQGDDRRACRAFLLLMLAFSCGCITARIGGILCALSGEAHANDIMVLLSILAVIGAMILCIKNGIVPRRLGELFHYGEDMDEQAALPVRTLAEIDRVSQERNLGAREKEVLTLLLQKRSASEIAAELVIANGTAKSHIRHVYRKLNVHSRPELFDLFG
ncbi:helix-turn-helix transcriptional regulator [Arabiibacter massiliensis]|uniref:helix-turn-helix transcriptional regulator n=1 Tax=Arabiibacter massiliensis TaxID=1870985 RepID=UPI001E4449D0|nr:helix-turn-helix transcriptional regulator [Arabiibacter massiliensis]